MRFSRFLSTLIGLVMIGTGLSLQMNPGVSEAAFGTSPPWVRNDHMLPGTTYEQIVNLSRNDPSRRMQAKLRIDGKEMQKWLKVENEDNLIMEKGVKVLPMKVTIKVPRRAALKDYRGGIFVTLESIQDESNQQGGNVAIKLGAHILVEISVVGDKIVDYRVKSITTDPLDDGDVFHMNVELENLGNTELTELNGQLDIYDKKETEILKSLTFGDLARPISPDEHAKTRINFPDFEMDPGEYWVVVKVFKDEKVIYENRLFQKINEPIVPIITPEDVGVKKPSLPKLPSAEDEVAEETAPAVDNSQPQTTQPVVIQEVVRPAASETSNTLFVVFGIVGLFFGFVALLSIVILLVVLVRNQRQAAIQRYLAEQQKFHLRR